MPATFEQVDPNHPAWAVHRQDDNGNRFLVATGLSRVEAERLSAELESRGHKQVYWVEPQGNLATLYTGSE